MINAERRHSRSLLDDYCLQLGTLLERRHTERALIAAKQRAEAAARLAEDALVQAQAADRAKTNFLANVTHELRTPLNAIIGFSEIIGGAPQPNADHTAYAKYIHDAGTRLLGIVNGVLSLARIEANKLDLDEQLVSLDEVLRASIRALRPEADAKSIAISGEQLIDYLVYADPSKLKQVFIHLLSNAIKFNDKSGSVDIASSLNESGDLMIAIRDTGCGIPRDHLERVLEPFGQVEDHLTRQNEGVGLGLALARGLVALHRGQLALASTVGIGTTVTVRLPADRLRVPPSERAN